MAYTGSKTCQFHAGEGIVLEDINQAQSWMTSRSWEVQEYANLIAMDQFGASFGSAFSGDSFRTRKYCVYTRGSGLVITNNYGAGISIGAGDLGIWSDAADDLPLPPTPASQHMRWVNVAASDFTYAPPAASTGKARWDLITCKINEVDGDQTTRTFEDAVTKEKTTQQFHKSKVLTLDLSASTSITSLAESESPTRPGVSDVPAGRYALLAIKVGDSGILAIEDLTVPVGRLCRGTTTGADALEAHFVAYGYVTSERWSVLTNGGISTDLSSGGAIAFLPPREILGDPSVRIVGARLIHKLKEADSVLLRRCYLDGVKSDDEIYSLTASITHDGTAQNSLIDFRGFPYLATGTRPPLWGNGYTTKDDTAGDNVSCPQILVVADGEDSEVYSLTWYWIKG